MSDSASITAKAKSNLAFTFANLSPEQREAMVTYYAYCRVIDDIADECGRSPEDKQKELQLWENGILHGFQKPSPFQSEIVALIEKHDLDPELMVEVIRGCAKDIHPQRLGTYEELEQYCYQVASSVGLISIKLFGCTQTASRDYAYALGQALQMTNILRDIGEDLRNEFRIYLPLADLNRFQYTERDLLGQVYDGRFLALMQLEAKRARDWYLKAQSIYQSLPKEEQICLAPAEMMAEIYSKVLHRMEKDHFRVFQKRYALRKWEKLLILLRRRLFPTS